MNKRKWIYIAILLVLFVLLIFAEGSKRDPINWDYSFSRRDKIPYGAYVLRDLFKETFPEKEIIDNYEGIYMYARLNDIPRHSAFVFVTHNFDPDKYDLEKLISIADAGNDVFVAAEFFSEVITDSLKFEVADKWSAGLTSDNFVDAYLGEPESPESMTFDISDGLAQCYFSSFDTINSEVIGTDNNHFANLIKMKQGRGNIFISTVPLLYTNYSILYGDSCYPFASLSYLKGNTIVWDEYYKPNKPIVGTPLRYILKQPSLKAAYILIVICILIYLVFGGKRRQRIVPVIKPHKNMSLDFAVTIGRLYFNSGSNKDIALKKFHHFCDYLRTRYNINTISFNANFYELVAEKTGTSFYIISGIFKNAEFIMNQLETGADELISFNGKIEEFYTKTK